MKASQLTVENISILLKSPPGFGKTLAASSWCLAGPIYIAYFDKNKPIELDHWYRRVIKRPELLDNIDYDVYGSSNAGEYLTKMLSLSKECRYVAVITDSITNLTSAAVNWSLGYKDSKKKDKKDTFVPDWDEYKVETSLVTQAIDAQKKLPATVIWTAHPLPSTRIEGSGSSIKVTKVTSIVTYGSKVAGLVPGNFTEIYHFSKQTDYDAEGSHTKFIVDTEAIGDDYAKTALGLKRMDITNKLFYEVWMEQLKNIREEK